MVGSTLEEKKSEENDILICKFMGLSSRDGFWRVPIEINSDKQRIWTHDVKIGYMVATKDLCFSSSWDWILPVLRRLSSFNSRYVSLICAVGMSLYYC